MNAVTALGVLADTAERRLLRLRALVHSYSPPIRGENDRAVAFVVIEALNLWDAFARSYYLSCAFGTKLRSGHTVRLGVPGLRSGGSALRAAIASSGRRAVTGTIRRRDEPSWHDVQFLLNLFIQVGASQLPQIQTALSYPTDVFLFLPTIRNFFAHRNQDTAEKVRNAAPRFGILGPSKPSDIVCSWGPNRPQNILGDWLDDMRAVISFMC
jgi:hypothetical protein